MVLILCLSICTAATNAPVEYDSRIWQTDEGLPQNGVQAIAQTRDGFIWVGTVRGLTRFDGDEFKVYDSRNTPEIKNSSISVLSEGRDGSLWVGTVGGGLTRLKWGRFEHFDLEGPDPARSIKAVLQAKDDSVWVGTLGGLYHLKNGFWTHITVKTGLTDEMVRCLCEVDGDLWVGTSQGLNILKQSGEITNVLEFSGKLIRSITRDHAGRIWLGCQTGLAEVDHGRTNYFSKTDGLPDNNVTTICEDKRGQVWIGTFSGLGRWVEGKMQTERDHEGRYFDQVNAIIEDVEGDIWLGCRNGLQELRAQRFKTYTRENGLAHNNVMSVLEDKAGAIWVASWGGGVSRMSGGVITNFGWEARTGSVPMSELMLSLLEDRDGKILVGADYDGGIYSYDGSRFTNLWEKSFTDSNTVIRVMHRDRKGSLWIGTDAALIKEGSPEKFLEGNHVRCMIEDHDGGLLAGCTTGLFRNTGDGFKPWPQEKNPLRDTVVALYEDSSHSTWIGTVGGGLKCYRNGALWSYTAEDGLTSDDVFEIIEDDRGWLWMSSHKGIFRVEKKNLLALDPNHKGSIRCLAYGKGDGLETLQCNGVAKPAAWKGRDGRIWFATAQGLSVTDTHLDLRPNDRPPVLILNQVTADKVAYDYPAKPWTHLNSKVMELIVPPGRGEIEFHYGALSFQAPEKIRFRYRLQGIDPDWVEVSRRVAYYNHLPPARYSFQVIACNNDGVWNNSGLMVEVVLQPHFWQMLWFKVLIVIAGMGFAGLVVRHFIRRKLLLEMHRLERERAVEHERIRIARDMHDEIGAKLTKISFLGAMAKRKLAMPAEAGLQIDKMSTTARDVIRSLDEIVWALNPANDSLENLANYLARNATEFFDDSPILCHLDIPEVLPVQELGMDVRHNLVLASKEALNNVLKHSGATTVHIEISIENKDFIVRISDNGRGFDPSQPEATSGLGEKPSDATKRAGNGLANMENRLLTIGGVCTVRSTRGIGTTIEFRVECLDGVDMMPMTSISDGAAH